MQAASYFEIASIEATQQIAAAVVKAAGEVMATHGNDPNGSVIVAAGFTMALRNMGKHIDPMIPELVWKGIDPD